MEILKTKDDFFTSVERAFDEIDGNWRKYEGLVVLGSHAPTLIDEKIARIKDAREKGTPFLGICFGMQLAVIEYARNVLKEVEATSQEFGKGTYFIKRMSELRVGMKEVRDNYGTFYESHWHNYCVNNDVLGGLLDAGLSVTEWGDGNIVERVEIKNHPHFVAVQYHPEYQSTEDKPHRVLLKFINACRK